jgi:hypothetical protein
MSRDGNDRPGVPDPEVVPVAHRRRLTAEEKLRILEEADACTEPGEIGALVRQRRDLRPSRKPGGRPELRPCVQWGSSV